MTLDLDPQIRQVLRAHAQLVKDADALDVADDLFEAGMTSHASVTVMLALEDEWDFEFPQRLLTRATFTSIETIRSAVLELTGGGDRDGVVA